MANTTLINLGDLYVSDFCDDKADCFTGSKYPLTLEYNERLKCAVLTSQPPHEMMWGKYWYRSAIQPVMKLALESVVNDTLQFVGNRGKSPIWLDIASNDGTLLFYVPSDYRKIAIDPCEGDIADQCKLIADVHIQDYFSSDVYNNALSEKADVVTCCAMFYDLQDPVKFLMEVADVMKDDALLVIQLTYTPFMWDMLDVGNICHEHYAYHTMDSIAHCIGEAGLYLRDVVYNDVNGGSVRVTITKNPYVNLGNPVKTSIGWYRVQKSLANTKDPISEWEIFGERLSKLKYDLYSFLQKAKAQGKRVWGYGASTKANTILQILGLSDIYIDAIAERSPSKFNKFTKGSGIKILSELEFQASEPDYTIVFIWQFMDAVISRESEYLQKGGTLIFLSPQLLFVTKDGIQKI